MNETDTESGPKRIVLARTKTQRLNDLAAFGGSAVVMKNYAAFSSSNTHLHLNALDQIDSELEAGDTRALRSMLAQQAIKFNAIADRCANLAAANLLAQNLQGFERLTRLACSAREQSQTAAMGVLDIVNPRIYAKQANINNGGQQQVNNGGQLAVDPTHYRARVLAIATGPQSSETLPRIRVIGSAHVRPSDGAPSPQGSPAQSSAGRFAKTSNELNALDEEIKPIRSTVG